MAKHYACKFFGNANQSLKSAWVSSIRPTTHPTTHPPDIKFKTFVGRTLLDMDTAMHAIACQKRSQAKHHFDIVDILLKPR